jgi:ABC-type Fe3+-citrate transport system substrate-binding protein
MKKFITIITAVILLAVLITGCGSGTGSNESAMDTNGQMLTIKARQGKSRYLMQWKMSAR